MVDFNKLREKIKTRGEFIGYCPDCDTFGKLYEADILPAYKDLPESEQKAKCPKMQKILSGIRSNSILG